MHCILSNGRVVLSDIIFKPNHKLRPLSEVERFVKINKHLSEIPSEAEVQDNAR